MRELKTNGEKPKQGIHKKKPLTRSWSNLSKRSLSFLNFKMITNLLPAEATHTKLDLFEKQPLLINFDKAFTQKG